MGCGCKKKGKKVARFSNVTYILKDASGKLAKEFGNKATAATELRRHPGWTLHPVQKSA